MEKISIQTSQNIAIEQPIASVGERIVAAILDYAFIGVYAILISIVFVGASQAHPVSFILFLPVIFYFLVSELAMNGQSWGKRIMKIKVVKADGTQTGFISFFLRWVFRLIDIMLLFGGISVLTIILNGKGQRIGDIVANTTVIRLKDNKINETLYMKLPENYTISFPEVKMLTENELHTIKEVLQHLEKSKKSMKALHLADKARIALEKKMGIKAGMRSEFFLYTLLKDYNYIHSK